MTFVTQRKGAIQLESFPHDLLLRCLKFLQHPALCRLACVSKSFAETAGDSELWRCLFARAVPCRTSFDVSPSWQQLLRLIKTECPPPSCNTSRPATAEKCWFKVSYEHLEVPVPYSSTHAPADLLTALIALLAPQKSYQAAVLRRFDRNVPGAALAEVTSEHSAASSPIQLLDSLSCSSSELSTDSIAHLNLPRVLSVQLCFGQLEELRKEGADGTMLLNIWTEDSVTAGAAQRVWVRRADDLQAVKQQLCEATRIPVESQRLFTLRSHHDAPDAEDDAGARVGAGGGEEEASGSESWARGLQVVEVKGALSEAVEVGRCLMWSSGEHVVVRDARAGKREGAAEIEGVTGGGEETGGKRERERRAFAWWRASTEWGQQGQDGRGLGRVRVWVNVPETFDYSVEVWVEPRERFAGLRRRIAGEERLALPKRWWGHAGIWSAGREALDEERCQDLGIVWGAAECRVQITTPGFWGAGGGTLMPEEHSELTAEEVERAVAEGGRRGRVDEAVWGSVPPEGLSPWEFMDGEAELLAGQRALRPGGLVPVRAGLGPEDCIRQLEWCPHAPGVMLVGSYDACVAAVALREEEGAEDEDGAAGAVWKGGPVVRVEGHGEVLALQWLRRSPQVLLAGILDAHSGEGRVEVLRWDGGTEIRGWAGEGTGLLGQMGYLNSVCSNASDEVAMLAGADRLSFVDLGSGKVLHEVGSGEWHTGLVNCPKFSNGHPALAATGGLDKHCCLWDLRSSFSRPVYRRLLPAPIGLLHFSPADDLLLASGLDNSLVQLCAVDGRLHCELELEPLQVSQPRAKAALDTDAAEMGVRCADVRVWPCQDPHNYTRGYYSSDGRFIVSVSRLQDEVRLHYAQAGDLCTLLRLRDRKPYAGPHPLPRTCRPDPFHPYRFGLLVDGMHVPTEGGDSTLAYTFDLAQPANAQPPVTRSLPGWQC